MKDNLKHLIFITLLLGSLCSTFALIPPKKQILIDSLNHILSQNPHDTVKARTYVDLSEIYYAYNLDTVVTLCEVAEKIAGKNIANKKHSKEDKKVYKAILADALNNIGTITSNKGNSEIALNYFDRSLEIQLEIQNYKGVAASYNNIGFVHKKNGDLPRALEFYLKALKIKEELQERKDIAIQLNNIGRINKSLGDDDKALENYQKCLKISSEIGDKRIMALSMGNIGAIYMKKQNLDEALLFLQKALALNEEIGYQKGIALSLGGIASVYKRQGKIDEALLYYNKSLVIRKETNDKKSISSILFNLGDIFIKTGELNKALSYAKQSLALAEEIDDIEEKQSASNLLGRVYKRLGDYKTSLRFFEYEVQMKDSIFNMENNKAILLQQAKYVYEKQSLADSLAFAEQQRIEKLQYDQSLSEQRTYTYVGVGGFILMLLLAIVIFRGYNEKKKNNLLLEQQKTLIQQKNHEITSSITYAKRIQTAILPSSNAMNAFLKKGFVFYRPKDIVAGDFYWMHTTDNTVIYAVADCTGHGVPGAMVSVICHNALNRSIREYHLTKPAEILNKTRELVIETLAKGDGDVKDGMDIALCSINFEKKELQYAGAYNPLYLIRKGELLETKADKQPIGNYSHNKPFTNHTISLEKGDSIYTFTDGYADQFGGPKEKKFMYKPFKRLLLSVQEELMENQEKIIEKTFNSWKGDLEQIDDVCILGVKI